MSCASDIVCLGEQASENGLCLGYDYEVLKGSMSAKTYARDRDSK